MKAESNNSVVAVTREVSEDGSSAVEIIPFAVGMGAAAEPTSNGPDEGASHRLRAASNGLSRGIVGTILLMNKKSAYIWLGWGEVMNPVSVPTSVSDFGASTSLSIGPLITAMPRTRYQGAFSEDSEGSTSKLIGSDNEEEEMLARNMSAKISRKLGIPVMLSCSFDASPATLDEGVDNDSLQHGGISKAERKIIQILQRKL